MERYALWRSPVSVSQRFPQINMTRSALLQTGLAVSITVLAGLGLVKAWPSPDSATLAVLLALIAASGAAIAWLSLMSRAPQTPSHVAELARMHSLLTQFPEGVVLLDATGRIVFANPLACSLLEQPREELVGQRAVNNGWEAVGLAPGDVARDVLPDIDAFANPEKRVRYRRRDQTEIELVYRLLRLQGPDAAPQVVGYAWIFREATGVATIKQHTLNTQALGLALQAKSTFMMSIAHELRNPLAAIAGAVSLVERQLGPRADSRTNSHLHILKSATKHLGSVIDNAFDASRQHVGQPKIRLEVLAVAPLVRDAVGMIAEIADENGIRLSCDAIDLDLGVRADATRLTQVLINLLTNALKYNRPGGNVFVRVLPTADHIALSVEDTGYGIQPKNLVRIFHLFERADAAESTIGGAGIGLALAKYYVERMQGRIEVTSIVGVGSRFTVTLPRGNLGGPTTSGTLPDAATSA